MCMKHWYRGRASNTAYRLLMGDPVLDLATASMRRWAVEVWRSDFDRRAFSRSVLQQLFASFCSLPRCSSWRTVRGPLSAAALEVHRLGWAWVEPFKFVDQHGVAIDLVLTSPGRLRELIGQASSQALGAKLGGSVGVGPVDPSPVQAYLRSKHCDPRSAALIRSLFCCAWHSREDLRRMGYGVPLTCE